MYFSIAAPQVITLPDGTVLTFKVNEVDSSLVHLLAASPEGTHCLVFKRNGTQTDTFFHPTKTIEDPAPLAGYASVNDEPIRGPYPDTDGPVDTKPAA